MYKEDLELNNQKVFPLVYSFTKLLINIENSFMLVGVGSLWYLIGSGPEMRQPETTRAQTRRDLMSPEVLVQFFKNKMFEERVCQREKVSHVDGKVG